MKKYASLTAMAAVCILLFSCIFQWDYDKDSFSYIHFENTENTGIYYAALSNYPNRTDEHTIHPAVEYTRLDYGNSSISGPQILKNTSRVASYLLWLGEDSSVVLCWNLSANTADPGNRWLDPEAWVTDTSVRAIFRAENDTSYEYHHTFTFRPEDVR